MPLCQVHTRTVSMMGGMDGYEEFVAWEPGKRMAFTFVGCTKDATEKFLEDYRVTDLGDGSCKVEWYMAMEPRGFSRHLMWMTRPIMRMANRRMFGKFREIDGRVPFHSELRGGGEEGVAFPLSPAGAAPQAADRPGGAAGACVAGDRMVSGVIEWCPG